MSKQWFFSREDDGDRWYANLGYILHGKLWVTHEFWGYK